MCLYVGVIVVFELQLASDSDDDAPMPKPYQAIPQLGGKSLHPPPPKQLRASVESSPKAGGIGKGYCGRSAATLP